VLWGDPGCGKTHLLAAAFNAMVDADRLGAASGRLPLYVVVPALLDYIREGVQAGDYSGRFASVALCPVLLLDDLGAEKRSEWSDEALFKLLDHRYRHGLRTAVATNLAPDELEPRISSRLQDRAVSWVYGMRGPDYRQSDIRAAGSGRAS
jgi:DNA replication protein DnaC